MTREPVPCSPVARLRLAACIVGVATVVSGVACRERGPTPEEVTRTSTAALDEGRRLLAARDFAAAREAFAAAADGGGLQPDFYCEARLQQAVCTAQLGRHEEAIALLEELATGAPDTDRINSLLATIRAQQAEAVKQDGPKTPEEPSANP